MKAFWRSLRYLWPYRGRLVVSGICVVFIAVLWGGGLGMLLPGLKILISDEGLHGWAWNSIVADRMQVKLVSRRIPLDTQRRFDLPADVIDVVRVEEGGPAWEGGVRANVWIVGLADAGEAQRRLRADALMRRLAHLETDKLTLRLFDQNADDPDAAASEATVTPGDVELTARLLGRVARAIPEPDSRAGRFPMLLGLLIAALVITLLRDVLRFVQEYLVETAVYRSMMDLRCENYNTALRLPVSFFSRSGTSDTMSRFIQDTGELGRGQRTLFGKTLTEPAKAIAALVAALLLSWELTLIALVAGPPVAVVIRKLGKRMRRASRGALESWSGMLAVLEETLTGIRVVKAYTMEAAERKRFFRVNRRLLGQQARMALIDAGTAPTVEMLGMTAALSAAALAGYSVLHGTMDPYVFMTWMAALAMMFDPLRRLAKVATRFQRADAAARRVFELRDREQEKRIPGAPSLPRHRESLAFRDVHFRYPGATDDALRGVDLDIRSGETVAIVGPNGCGKTTLVSLVPRLFDPTGGAVLIDGQDVAQVSLRSLRRQVGLVTQDTVLFNATIRENVAYGLRRPDAEDVLEAAKRAYVDEFVRELPEGYETMVGEHGATLSGGQKQRITIARAILRDPAILIFDEATSQIDADSERRIHQAMEQFIEGRTTLMIAHRFATVLSADRIVVMSAGGVIDVGAHAELLDRCGLYRHLYQTQFSDTGG